MTPLAKTTKFGYTRLKLLSRPVIVLPLIVLAVFIIAAFVTSYMAQSTLDSTRQHAIERRAQEDSLELSSSLQSYQLIAASGAGFANTATVTRDSWDSFVSSFDIAENFPAINAVTYAWLQDNGNNGQSLAVTYAYPDTPSSQSRLGLDEYTFPSRVDAVDRAIASNKPALTRLPESIHPSGDPSAPAEPGFIMFAPIYDQSKPLATADDRRAALLGTANVSFRASKFFDTIYAASEQQTKTYLTVYQGTGKSAEEVYSGGVHPAHGDEIDYTQTIPYGGQTFVYKYQFSNSDLLTLIERDRPVTILLAGIFIGGLLAGLMLFGIRNRLHRVSMEKERDVQTAKDELLSLASHQLRTPATGVKQYMGMVLQGFAGDITDQQKEFLQKAYDSNDRQLHIINDILHLAKLDAGRIVLSKTKFDMSELVCSVLDEQASSAADAEIILSHRVPKKLEVYADSHMLRMVVENLISNAIKYTNPGGKVNVALKSTKEAIELQVRDTGVGISEDDFDKLFKQFSRVANERSHLVSGTGVGLYLVKNLIELHGGDITVSSRAGRGTTFTLSLPH